MHSVLPGAITILKAVVLVSSDSTQSAAICMRLFIMCVFVIEQGVAEEEMHAGSAPQAGKLLYLTNPDQSAAQEWGGKQTDQAPKHTLTPTQ